MLCCELMSPIKKYPNSPHLRGHNICKPCVTTYLKGKILDDGVVKINCPAANCGAQLRYEEIKLFFGKESFRQVCIIPPVDADIGLTRCYSEKCWKKIQISDTVPAQHVHSDKSLTTAVILTIICTNR